MSWPVAVPVLTEANICKGTHQHPSDVDCCCTSRWLCRLFGGGTPEFRKALRTLFNVLDSDETFYDPDDVGPMTAMILWNEDNENTKKYIAKKLNECFRLLGYTEIEEVPVPYDLLTGKPLSRKK